jgi:hypothetical protein
MERHWGRVVVFGLPGRPRTTDRGVNLCSAGLYRFSVAKLEQGVREPTWPTVLALAKALGLGVADFAAGRPDSGVSPATASRAKAKTGQGNHQGRPRNRKA